MRRFFLTSCFAVAFTIFLSSVYLANVNIGYYIHWSIFWISVACMAICLAAQVFWVKISPRIILLEIFLFTLALHLVVSMPGAGLVGHDVHFDYAAAKAISENGWPISADSAVVERTLNYSEWPILQILAGVLAGVTQIDLLVVAKFLAPFTSSLAVLFIYLLAKSVYDSDRVALVVSFVCSSLFWFIYFDSRFVRESLGFTLFFAILYLFVQSMKTGKKTTYFLTIFLSCILVFTHHLSSFNLLTFSFVFVVVIFLYNLKGIKSRFAIEKTQPFAQNWLIKHRINFCVLLLTLNILYWLFIGGYVTNTLSLMLNDFQIGGFGYKYASSLTGTSIRTLVASYGNILILSLICVAVVIELFRRKNSKNLLGYTLFTWGILMISFGYLSVFVSGLARLDFSRFIGFGYPLVLITGLSIILKNHKKTVVAALVVCIVLLQFFTIPPYFYDRHASPEYSTGGYREFYLPQEYQAATWSNLTGKIAGDWTTDELFGGLGNMQVYYEQDSVVQIFEGNFSRIGNFHWFIFRQEDLLSARVGSARVSAPFAMSTETHQNLLGDVNLNKSYDNGEVEIYDIYNATRLNESQPFGLNVG